MTNSGYRILVVDDNRANLRILEATFVDEGFEVLTATSVDEACSALLLNGSHLNLVLSDIQMPGQTGFDLVKWMKSETSSVKDIPILLITSQEPSPENRILGLSLGAFDYFLRTLDPAELVLRVKLAIEHFLRVKSLQQTLERTETLASTGRMFAASNHEIKNVAQIIAVATNVLDRELAGGRNTEDGTRALGMLKSASQLLMDFTKVMGSLVSDTVPSLVPVALDGEISQVLTMVKPLTRGRIKYSYKCDSASKVLGSSTLIKQILINLLFNARDSIEEAAQTNSCGAIDIRVEPSGDGFCRIIIKDNGIGLPSPSRRTVFEAFSSTKKLRGGTGLGLWLCSSLAHKMNGSVALESEGPGRGAVACLSLPMVC